MSRVSPNTGYILVDGVEYDVSNLLSAHQSVQHDKDRSPTVPNYYPRIEPSPWQPESRKRSGREQPRMTSTLHTLSPSKKVLPRTNSRRWAHKSHSFSGCSPTKKPKGDLRNYLTLQQRFDSSLRALLKPPPPHASSSNNSVPPPPPPPMENDADNFEQDWTSPIIDGEYERKNR